MPIWAAPWATKVATSNARTRISAIAGSCVAKRSARLSSSKNAASGTTPAAASTAPVSGVPDTSDVTAAAPEAVMCSNDLLAAAVLAPKAPDPEKLSAYECGFNAFDDARMKFDVRFYLVSILFIIFDLEVAFLFPWAVSFQSLSDVAFWSMMVFLGVLTIGFIYEWKKGALEWE